MYRSFLVSLLLIGAVTTLVTQTGANFVDSGASASNSFTAGKVDLQVNWSGNHFPCTGLNGIDGFISYNVPKMLPGDSATQSLAVLNPSAPTCVSTYSTLPLRYSATSFAGVMILDSSSIGSTTTIDTVAAHNLQTGDTVTIVGHTPAISGSYPVTVTSTTAFTIPVGSPGSGAQTGSVQPMLASQLVLTIKYNKHTACDTANFNNLPTATITGTDSGNPVTITTNTALTNLATGDQVVITGNTYYSGTYTITKTGTYTFTIPKAGNGSSGGTVTVQDGVAYQGQIGNATGQTLWASSPLTNGGDRVIPVAGSDNLCFNVALPASSPDIYQSAGSTLTFRFNAQQTTNNP